MCKRFKAKGDWEGKQVGCPQCKKKFVVVFEEIGSSLAEPVVPSSAESSPPTSVQGSRAREEPLVGAIMIPPSNAPQESSQENGAVLSHYEVFASSLLDNDASGQPSDYMAHNRRLFQQQGAENTELDRGSMHFLYRGVALMLFGAMLFGAMLFGAMLFGMAFLGLRQTFQTFSFDLHVTTLLICAAENNMEARTMRSIQAVFARLSHAMTQIQQSTTHLMYPFEHGLKKISLAHYLVPELPTVQDVTMMEPATDLEKNLDYLLMRAVARLGALAEKVEKAFGFDPLQTPDEIRKLQEQ